MSYVCRYYGNEANITLHDLVHDALCKHDLIDPYIVMSKYGIFVEEEKSLCELKR